MSTLPFVAFPACSAAVDVNPWACDADGDRVIVALAAERKDVLLIVAEVVVIGLALELSCISRRDVARVLSQVLLLWRSNSIGIAPSAPILSLIDDVVSAR